MNQGKLTGCGGGTETPERGETEVSCQGAPPRTGEAAKETAAKKTTNGITAGENDTAATTYAKDTREEVGTPGVKEWRGE